MGFGEKADHYLVYTDIECTSNYKVVSMIRMNIHLILSLLYKTTSYDLYIVQGYKVTTLYCNCTQRACKKLPLADRKNVQDAEGRWPGQLTSGGV